MKKRIGTLLLSATVAVTMIAGCSQQPGESSAVNSAAETTTAATSAQATGNTGTADPQEPQSFEELYATQLTNYLDHQYYFDGKAIPLTESNFYFINAFLDLSNYALMGYYPSTNLQYIDLAAEYQGEEYGTYGDYYVMYAENSLESSAILCARAEAEGVTLSAETKEAMDGMIEDIRNGSAANSGKSLDDYLQFYYGPGMNEANFRYALERYYLADAYSKVYCENYPFTEEEKNVPYVRYALFYAPETAEQSAKDQALEAATAMKDACGSIDDLTGLAQSAQEMGTVYDQGDIAVPRGQMVPKFEEWAYEEERSVGELDIIYAPEYGYFVVGYIGLQEQSADILAQTAMQNLSKELLDEIDAKKHDFHTDDVFLPAPAGPTATPVPDYAIPTEGVVFNPDSTAATVPAVTAGGNQTQSTQTDTLIVVFFTLAGVAIAAVIVILIVSAVKNSKNGETAKSSSSKTSSKSAPKSSSKASKKNADEEDDGSDDDFDDDEE